MIKKKVKQNKNLELQGSPYRKIKYDTVICNDNFSSNNVHFLKNNCNFDKSSILSNSLYNNISSNGYILTTIVDLRKAVIKPIIRTNFIANAIRLLG